MGEREGRERGTGREEQGERREGEKGEKGGKEG